MELKININGVTEEQAKQIYQFSLQYFDREEIAQLANLPVDLVTKVLERFDKLILRVHTNHPERRFGDPVNWQHNLDELIFIRSEAWRVYTSGDVNQRLKALEQLRKVNRDVAELQGLLAPVKVESATTLTIADESRKALKEIFNQGGK